MYNVHVWYITYPNTCEDASVHVLHNIHVHVHVCLSCCNRHAHSFSTVIQVVDLQMISSTTSIANLVSAQLLWYVHCVHVVHKACVCSMYICICTCTHVHIHVYCACIFSHLTFVTPLTPHITLTCLCTGTRGRVKKAVSFVVDLDQNNFDAVVKDPAKNVLVEFYAPCKSQPLIQHHSFICTCTCRLPVHVQ